MNKKILSLVLFIALFFMANTASARGVIIYSNGEKIEVVKELPDEAVVGTDNEHVNLGVMYSQFSIFWIPIWNYGETKYVLVNDKKNTYYDVDEEDIDMLKTEFNVEVPPMPAISFWNKTGGKLVWGVLILAIIFGNLLTRNKNNEKVETPNQEAETPDQEAEN